MFCVVNITERKNTFKEKILWRFIKDEYDLKIIPVFKGAPFYRLDISVGKRGVDWEYVSCCTGKCAGRLLLNETVSVPENIGIGKYENKALYEEMMQNTFVHILDKQKQVFENLCFVDEAGKHSKQLKNYVPYFKKITVVTKNKADYFDACEEVLDETGLSVVLKSQYEEAQAVIDCKKNTMNVKKENSVYNIGNGEDFEVPEIYAKLYDETVDKLIFYSALYEFCGVFDLANLIFSSIQVNTEKKGTNAVIFT